MLYCGNCREFAWESEAERQDGGYGYECPYCGETDDIVEAGECEHCGENFPPDEIEGGLCPDCIAKMQKQFTEFWDSLPVEFQNYVLETDYFPSVRGD